MNIMIIIPSLGYGGAESLVLQWINHWIVSADVSRITLVLYNARFIDRLGSVIDNPRFRLEIEDTNTPWRMFRPRYFLHWFRLWKIIRRDEPDIIHTHLAAGIDLALLYFLLPGVKGFVHTFHCVVRKKKQSFYRWLLHPFLVSRRCRLVAISDFVRQSVKASYRLDSTVIYNGAEIPPETDQKPDVAAEIRQLRFSGGDGEKKVFIAVGRYAPEKCYELMVEVFQRLFQQKIPVILIVLGDLFSDRNRKKFLPLNRQNIFFLDRKANVGDYLRCADFYFSTSPREGLSIGIIEAVSVGLLPVIPPTGGLTEVIPSEAYGVIASGTTMEDYCQAVRRALALTAQEKTAIRENNFRRYREMFAMTRCAESYLALFKRIVKPESPNASVVGDRL